MNANGKICYVEIPTTNIQESADFYSRVFGWSIKKRGDGSTAFDDPTGGVSGTWVLNRPLAVEPGLFMYIMVANMEATAEAISGAGGEMLKWVSPEIPEIAKFRDPAGNIVGLYHQVDL
jgi:predicted enzyme related to lactoylglutathione lyase